MKLIETPTAHALNEKTPGPPHGSKIPKSSSETDLGSLHSRELEGRFKEVWETFPSERREEVMKAYRPRDLPTAVKEVREINNSLGKIKSVVEYKEQLPLYQFTPNIGELRVIGTD